MKHFKGDIIFTVVALLLAGVWGYYEGGMLTAIKAMSIASILGVLEVSLSFDNAVVNASTLEKMDDVWKHRFLTWGMIIAVFGMRLVFPVAIVSVVASLDPITVINIALTKPDEYAKHLTASHAMIAAFGGMFLLMVFLKFLLDEEKEIHWIAPIEKVFAKLGKLEALEILIAMTVLMITQYFVHHDEKLSVVVSGIAGLMTYILVDSVASFMEDREQASNISGAVKKAGLATFLYLELLDASFSFDGVIGAFAITNDVITIAIGLGIGAMFVRSLTLFLVAKGTLAEYIFLEHGAHYAIGILAFIMMIGIRVEIPEVFTGLSGILFIGLSLWSSMVYKKKELSGN